MFSCFVFMFVRKFSREQAFLAAFTFIEKELFRDKELEDGDIKVSKARENADFLQATKIVIGHFNCIWMPPIMFGLYNYSNIFDLQFPKPEYQFNMLNIFQAVTAIIVLPEVFVKKKKYRSHMVMQILIRLAGVLVLLVAPIMSVSTCLYVVFAKPQPLFMVFYLFYVGLTLFYLYHFHTSYRFSKLSSGREIWYSDFWNF